MHFTHWFHQMEKESIYYEKSLIDRAPCRTLVLHGAWTWDTTRTRALREALFERGIPTLAIDFSWHGKSSWHEALSIRKRISEAREIAEEYLDTIESLQIIGFSMSGEVAIRLTEFFSVRSLVLFAPGIYHHEAIDIPFWEKFSEAIRKHESWKNHGLSRILEEYTGSIFLLTPEYDTVIPWWVNDQIMSVAPKANKKRRLLPRRF